MPAISVAAVIPLYNGAPFIREALESVINQTVPVDEIIVVDDGSTDGGAAIVEEMAAHHPITLLRKPNGGQSSARNMAIRHTHCTHIALLDQDDAWYEDHIARLSTPFVEEEVRRLGLVYGNLDRIDRNGRMISQCFLTDIGGTHPKTSLAQHLERDLFILPGASLISKKAVADAGYFDERLSGYEDDDLFLRIFVLGYRAVYLDVAVSQWRIYPTSTSYSPRMSRSRLIYFRKLIENFPNEPRLNLFWGRDFIGPRFFQIACNDFLQASKARDSEGLKRAWNDILEILPVLRKRTRVRVHMVRPLIELLYLSPLTGLARNLLRLATHGIAPDRNAGTSCTQCLHPPCERLKNTRS